MKTIKQAQTGYDTEPIGYPITHHSTMDTIYVASVDVGSQQMKSRLTTLNQEQQKICSPIGIYNQPMDIATTSKVHADGSPKLVGKRTNF